MVDKAAFKAGSHDSLDTRSIAVAGHDQLCKHAASFPTHTLREPASGAGFRYPSFPAGSRISVQSATGGSVERLVHGLLAVVPLLSGLLAGALPVQAAEPVPTVSVTTAQATVTEGTDAAFRFSRTGSTAESLSVGVNISGHEKIMSAATRALAGNPAPSTTVTFGAGVDEVTLTLTSEADRANEGDGEIAATVSGSSDHEVAGTGRATVLVEDDDIPVVSLRWVSPPMTVRNNVWVGSMMEGQDIDFEVVCSGNTLAPEGGKRRIPIRMQEVLNHPVGSYNRDASIRAPCADQPDPDFKDLFRDGTRRYVGPDNGRIEIDLFAQVLNRNGVPGLNTQFLFPCGFPNDIPDDIRFCPKFTLGAVTSARIEVLNKAPEHTAARHDFELVRLEWTAPPDDGDPVTGYEVYVERVDDGSVVHDWDPAGAGLEHTVTGLENGVEYLFRVRAVYQSGTGEPSNPLNATPVSLILTIVPHNGVDTIVEGEDARFDVVLSGLLTEWIELMVLYDYTGEMVPNQISSAYIQLGPRKQASRVSRVAATLDDSAVEPDGSVTVSLLPADGYNVGEPSSVTIRILDNDEPVINPTGSALWSTTLAIGDGNGRGFSSVASPAVGALGSDTFVHAGAAHRVRRVMATATGVTFETDGGGADFGGLVLEWAGEVLPLDAAQRSANTFTWSQTWLESNTYALTASLYERALPAGGIGRVYLRTAGQSCPPTLDLSFDATLSALALAWDDAGTQTAAPLSPAFASGTTSYTASVANAASRITVTPTPTVGPVTVTHVDADDTVLGDADPDVDGHQVALGVGATPITVKVRARDVVTTQTYTVVVTRAAPAAAGTLVSNIDTNGGGATLLGGTNSVVRAQKFTVPAGADYTLHSVRVHMSVWNVNRRVVATIRRGGGTNPGTALYTLAEPASRGSGNKTFTAPAGAVLEAGKSYLLAAM